MIDWDDILEMLRFLTIVGITIIFLVLIATGIYIIGKNIDNDYAKEITYYENDIKINAIKYQNEIYLKKGE